MTVELMPREAPDEETMGTFERVAEALRWQGLVWLELLTEPTFECGWRDIVATLRRGPAGFQLLWMEWQAAFMKSESGVLSLREIHQLHDREPDWPAGVIATSKNITDEDLHKANQIVSTRLGKPGDHEFRLLGVKFAVMGLLHMAKALVTTPRPQLLAYLRGEGDTLGIATVLGNAVALAMMLMADVRPPHASDEDWKELQDLYAMVDAAAEGARPR